MPPAAFPSRLVARAALVGGAALVAVGLARRMDTAPTEAAAAAEPAADFLIAAGDSTYWVTRPADARAAADAAVRVRASTLFVARWGGRLNEVYVTDDERAFDDGAWFATQRVYRRDLLTGDSALVYADPAVPRLAARYAAAHPDVRVLEAGEAPAAPEDDPDADAHVEAPAAEAAVALTGAHGPYVSIEQRTTGLTNAAEDGAEDAVTRRVVDLRTGAEVSLADLFGPAAAQAVAARGRTALASAVLRLRPAARRAASDAARRSLRGAPFDSAAAVSGDASRRALAAVGTLRFDAANFGLSEVAGAPAVTFVAVGREADAAPVTLALAPVAVPGAAPAWWRDEVAPALLLPSAADSSGGPARWRPARGAYEVRARRTAGATALELMAGVGPTGAAGPPGGSRAWPLARVPAGAAQLFPVDDRATRRALRRAFDESAFYDDAITSVAWRPGSTPRRGGPRSAARAARERVAGRALHVVRLAPASARTP